MGLTFASLAGRAKQPADEIALVDVIPEERSYDAGSESEGDIPPPERRPYQATRPGMTSWLLLWRSRSRKGSGLGRLLRQAFLGFIFVL